jgi:IS6 family transposase
MRRESHVRISESGGVKTPSATRPYIRIAGGWHYLCRAVDGTGQTVDFLLSAKRDTHAARWFFRRALGRCNTPSPRTIIADRLDSYRGALRAMKQDGELWRSARHRRGRW